MLKSEMNRAGKENRLDSVWKRILSKLKTNKRRENGSIRLKIIRGRFSLTDIRGCRFPGCQSAATALCALLQSKCISPSSWSPQVLDRLLLQGDKLHTARLHHLGRLTNGNGSLATQDLPTQFNSKGKQFNLKLNSISTPTANDVGNLQITRQYLRENMADMKDGVLVTCHGYTVSVIFDGNFSYIFSPTLMSKQKTNVFKKATISTLSIFADLNSCVNHLIQLLTINLIEDIAMTSVDIHVRYM